MTDGTFSPNACGDGPLLDVLLEAYSAIFTVEELARELEWPAERTEAALARLNRCGLAHRHDDLAFASRAARSGRDLAV